MGSKLSAFGVFQARRDSQAVSLNLGAASIGSDDYLAFYKDRFYVEIQAYITGKKETHGIETMASVVAERLPGDNTLPRELSYLPEKGRIFGSERYIRGGILGHGFLDRGIVCDYRIEGKKVSAFIAMLPSPRDAAGALQHHRSFLEKSGKKCRPLEGYGAHGFISEEPYHETIMATQVGAYVVGIYDLAAPGAGATLLEEIIRNLK